ncbi:MAG TPA: TIGR03435 family protein [Terracidiphilus sp.]|jgi:uncharacterized protein (TIGR03435 family)
MNAPSLITVLAVVSSVVFAQPPSKSQAFDVASVRPSRVTVGPDYNNQIAFTRDGFTASNVTLRRLIAEAWNVQLNQVLGPGWIDRNEYDINARAAADTTRGQMAPMIRNLLADRFQLRTHDETREMRVYELTTPKTGAKIRPVADGKAVNTAHGFHFHGDMRQFADLLALQFSIPAPQDPSVPSRAGGPPILVLDKTGLEGTFDFSVEIQPELNTDMFTVWRRALEDQLGLRIESGKSEVPVVVVENAAKIPTEN